MHGNHLLLKRIHEFSAIAKLEEISKSGEFQKALLTAAAKPVRMVGSTLRNPIATVKNTASGAGRFLKNVGESINRGSKKSAKMMALYHEQVSPVKQILDLYGIPAIHAQDDALVIPLSMDYGSWSAEADRLSLAIKNYNPKVTIARRILYVSGIVSPRAHKELKARGFLISDRASLAVYE